MSKQKFQVKLFKDENSAGVGFIVPFKVQEVFGSRAQVKVRGTIDGHPFRSSLAPMGGGAHVMPVKKSLREAVGKAGGETVNIVMEIDTEERTVAVPPDLEAAFKRAGVKDKFAAMAYTHRREYVEWVEGAKKMETRKRRIEQAAARIAEGKKFS
jgi:hypothetical protein